MHVVAPGMIAVLILGGCGASSPRAGAERGPCQHDGGCDPGLQCLSSVCVEIAGARCEQVGRQASKLLADTLPRRPLLAAVLGTAPAEVASQVTTACTADAWPTELQRCVLAARSHDRLEACVAGLPAAARAALATRFAAPAAVAWSSSSSPPSTAPPLTLTGAQLGPQCEAYLGLLGRYARCSVIPPEAQTSIASAVTTARQSFTSVPVGSRHLLEDGCRQAVVSMQGALTQLGCR